MTLCGLLGVSTATVADKRLERFHLECFLQARGVLLSGEPVPGEAPDFLLPTSEGLIGVEVSRFHRAPEPGERSRVEIDGLRKLCVSVAHRAYRAAGGPPLWVTLHFAHDDHATKADARVTGERLAEALLKQPLPRSLADGTLDVAWEHLPPTVTSCRVRASEDGAADHWSGDSGGWVAPVAPHHIQRALTAKQARLASYRQKAPRVWLLLVHDMFREPQPAELTDEAAEHVYQHGFDAAWWVEVHSKRIVALRSALSDDAA